MVDYPDIMNFTRDELMDEFCKLFDRYQDLRESNEADTQKIHELKRNLETAIAAQSYLSQELEQYTNVENNKDDNELQKALTELTELKKRYGKLEESYNSLQQDHNALLEENANLAQNLEEVSRRKENISLDVSSKTSEEDMQRIQMLESENTDLLEKMEDFQEQMIRYTLTIAECEKNIEILKDQIVCLEENLQSKKVDLEEKVQILESTQEQLAEANAQIAMLSAAPDNNDRKGNSLFAEVDDQRQAMKQLLTSQKKSYLQMKKIYNESEHEIRRLKRENIAMHTELEACTTIFCNADKVYQEKLTQRIRHLVNQNEELERKLKWNHERLMDLASEKGVLWLEPMLSFCKKETDDLKKQLHSIRLQQANLEEQQRNSQQDLARWKFEALKSRCILLDRENLLTEHKIDFKPVHAIEYHIPEKDLNEARPRIVSNRRSGTFDNIKRRSSLSKTSAKDENANSILKLENGIKQEDCDENNKDMEHKENLLKEKQPDPQDVSENKQKVDEPPINNENSSEEKENDVPLSGKFAKISPQILSPMRPSQRALSVVENENSSTPPTRSILTKQRDLLSKEPCKIVKFSSEEDLIHNITPKTPSPPEKVETLESKETSVASKDGKLPMSTTPATSATATTSSKPIGNKSRAKSSIVVRRVFVGSKHD
ncbi:spindle apparatus coiled-coil protein 1 spindly [Haematobia irritans]|uniref:spindle apparatus coiled-coil protein 1 spindly n=1 Tax=Haematobia irritans TaxID=7368 RepID=UPI003F4FBEE9